MNDAVLVLNQNYEPLNVCNVRRAIVLVFDGKAEVLEHHARPIVSASRSWESPSVIRMTYFIHRPRPRVKLTRREVFIRDGYTCQYCGRSGGSDLTIDHVIPRSRGGRNCWENLVSACRTCNHRKGGRLPSEARMPLKRQPAEPRAGQYYTIERRLAGDLQDAWEKFLPGFAPIGVAAVDRRMVA